MLSSAYKVFNFDYSPTPLTYPTSDRANLLKNAQPSTSTFVALDGNKLAKDDKLEYDIPDVTDKSIATTTSGIVIALKILPTTSTNATLAHATTTTTTNINCNNSSNSNDEIISTNCRAHSCKICERVFSRSDMLSRHMRLHTGQRPYICNTCNQVFSRSDHLQTHLRTHTGEKPYRCSSCSYAAPRRDMVTRHMRVHAK
ncbi:hypothetical protein HELRODRAFT_107565, partial [Helobdella robusta]|uniref:C2H2-type domain-containing protein n=1 Tax=Helobdella robusta TaxID=6412 RepID=T1EEB3_HELRO